MPSAFTPNLKLEKIAPGEQDNTWGDTTNDNWDKVDAAIGWHVVSTAAVTAPRDTVILAVPAGANRLRIEFQGIGGPVDTSLYLRLSTDNGASFAAGPADYSAAVDSFTSQNRMTPYGSVSSALIMTPPTLSPPSAPAFGDLDIDASSRACIWRVMGGLADGEAMVVTGGGYCRVGGTLSHLAMGLVGSPLTAGWFRLLAA